MTVKIGITPYASALLDAYILAAGSDEVSGLGIVQRAGPGLLITQPILLDQDSTAGRTALDTDAIFKLLDGMIDAGYSPEILRLWWHSHGNGGVFWSSLDNETKEKLVNSKVPWMLYIVGNTKLEYKCALLINDPVQVEVECELDVYVDIPDFTQQAEDEVEAKVRRPVKNVVVHNPQQHWMNPNLPDKTRYGDKKREAYNAAHPRANGDTHVPREHGRPRKEKGRQSVVPPVQAALQEFVDDHPDCVLPEGWPI